MEKNLNKKNIKKAKGTKQKAIVAELLEISQKREKELAEMDRIAKMLVKRDFELLETREKREKERFELDCIAKMLIRRTLELSEIREKREEEIRELEKTKKELQKSKEEFQKRVNELERFRRLTVGREMKMITLKKEIESLKKELKNNKP